MSDAMELRDQALARLAAVKERLANLEDERKDLESELGDLIRETGILAEVIQRGRAGGLRDDSATTEQGG